MSKWDMRFLGMANLVGSWSKDPSTQVGACIVDERNRIHMRKRDFTLLAFWIALAFLCAVLLSA